VDHSLRAPADGLLELALLAPESVDAVVTDPPYGTASATKVQTRSGQVESFAEDWDQELPLAWIPSAAAALVPGGACVAFTDAKAVGTLWEAFQEAGIRPLQVLAWTKPNPPPQPRRNFQSGVELAVYGRKAGPVHHWPEVRPGAQLSWRAVPLASQKERHAGCPGGRNPHRTVKPVEVMRWLVRTCCPEGGTVVDPFLGSGTTAVACELEGRRCVGWELRAHLGPVIEGRLEAWRSAWQVARALGLTTTKEIAQWVS
jgi:DNA modification methylase